jgi:aminoglycoside phosphotransferase (APT) family kinase protein
MLTKADADLARRDPGLPGLAMLLEADAFIDVLGKVVPRVPLSAARPVYVRYKAGTSCLVSYELTVAGARVRVHATAYTNDCRPLLQSPKRPSVPGPLGDGRFVIEEQTVEICVFPNDQALRGLTRLCEPVARDALIRKHCPDRPELWRSGFDPLAYKPGRRCVGLLTGRNAGRAIVKAFTAEGYERAQAGAHAFSSCGFVGVPRQLGHSTRSRLLVFEWLPGEGLADLFWSGRADAACVRRVGAALAMLHGQPGAELEDPRGGTPRETLAAVAGGIGVLCPQLADRAARLARDVATRMDERSMDHRPIHGDFYAGQVLIASDAVNVIDLDRAGRGDPRTDLGNFIAHLEWDALEGRVASNVVASLADALIAGYEEAAHKPCRGGIDAFVASALLGLAPRPFRARAPEWVDRTVAILDRAESLLTSSPGPRPAPPSAVAPVISDRFNTLGDRGLSLSPEALDPPAMERRLSQLSPLGDGGRSVRLCAIRVVRHKPGRRCLIEYDVIVSRDGCPPRMSTVVAKVRSKGADVRTYRLVQALWRCGFRDDSTDGISVPEPLGVLPELKMSLQWKAPGTPAVEVLGDGKAVAVARRVAAAICKLHASGVAASRWHGIGDELKILREGMAAVALEAAPWRQRLDAIFEASTYLANALPVGEPCGIHRDFHPGQVLIDGERVYLLDLDLYAAGDPALDVGNFLAHIAEYSLRAFADSDRLAACEAALRERFMASGSNVSAQSIEIYKTLSLARHIHISRLFPERRAFTERLIELCEARLGLRRSHPGTTSR